MKKYLFILLLLSFQTIAQNNIVSEPHRSVPVMQGKGQTNADLELIRKRVVADLMEPAVNVQEIKTLIKSQKPDGTWPEINYQDVSRTGFEHSEHLRNMLELSRAYKKNGSAFHENQEVKRVFSTALDFWLDHDFICDNWWWNEMGTPQLMINMLLVMDNDLTERQKKEGVFIAGRANLEASGARPGGDLIQIAGMRGKQALFQRNSQELAQVINVMASEIKVSTGRGMKPDLSFHHRTDNVISTLAYGTGYAGAFAYWAVKIEGTKYKLPDQAMKLLVDYFLDGICPSLIYGKYPDPGAENRGISRKGALNPVGPELAENLLTATSYRKAELENIVKIKKGEVKPNLTGDHYFWHSHYYTHQRRDYYVSVRMHSSRANNMEQPHNEEGLQNHHYGDGSNFISRTGKEYYQIFPVWDWQKIPGTTVLQKPAVAHWKELAKKGLTDFAGGVTDGRYGIAAFDFASVHDPLKARKSWFFFDKEYVSLGAGISSESELPVFTTLNQCLLKGPVLVSHDKQVETLQEGSHKLANVSWILHDSVAYLFSKATNLSVSNTTATGNWRRINHQSWATDEPVKAEVFTAWLDHGGKPENSDYQYIVVPGIGGNGVRDYVENPVISILANTPEIQAVQHRVLNQTGIVFYKAGKITMGNGIVVSAENPCLVIIKTKGNSIEKISVSDPTAKLKSIQLGMTCNVQGKGALWKAEWNKEKKASIITFVLPVEGLAGKTVVAEVLK
ncbi:polysaccharide lyase family 8 super-sandwich domain-containing protein [Dyadobacter sp. LHD-138]|uniref:polysaccharide lyase family 8 super-sandwich domain-containing protein n=1 Tax=Dyadobacter sp. LHD-138 TaxID=3071413 RepID=UPI0027DEB23B|nr:polysaccharide lyase family 8 super-sandwich domain-containing protein [Dyadobacter sp. LHD-138]MDQ6476944.1 polysaccharide lyase family 8 super-sandwich domain-containing protein [Dyadobacter sp. LHD-138]